jgi:hypothetical protein
MSNYYDNTSTNDGHESVAKRPKINYADDYDVDDFPVDVDPYSVAPVQELLQVQITLVDSVITVNLMSKSGFSILLSCFILNLPLLYITIELTFGWKLIALKLQLPLK